MQELLWLWSNPEYHCKFSHHINPHLQFPLTFRLQPRTEAVSIGFVWMSHIPKKLFIWLVEPAHPYVPSATPWGISNIHCAAARVPRDIYSLLRMHCGSPTGNLSLALISLGLRTRHNHAVVRLVSWWSSLVQVARGRCCDICFHETFPNASMSAWLLIMWLVFFL